MTEKIGLTALMRGGVVLALALGLCEAVVAVGPPLAGDARHRPHVATGLEIPHGGGERDLSEFMHGRVGINIIIPESNGGIDANEFNWTADQKIQIVSEIETGMAWWRSTIAGETGNLEFTFFVHDTVSIGYEPIRQNIADEATGSAILGAILTAMGQSTAPTAFEAMRTYNESVRIAHPELDWVTTMIVVNDGGSPLTFPGSGGLFAFAYYGGPFLILTYTNNGWGIENMDLVSAHEFGHIFYALDEYASAGHVGSETSGYVPTSNGNTLAEGGVINEATCIMRSAGAPLSTQTSCFYTRGQVGLSDTDGDRIPDILDLTPILSLDSAIPSTTDSEAFTVTGRLTAESLPNRNPNTVGNGAAMTINAVDRIEFRLDSGSWQAATPTDGAFDTPLERWSARVTSYTRDTHMIEIRGAVRVGHDSTRLLYSSIASGSFTSTWTTETSIEPLAPSDSTCTNVVSPTFRWVGWQRPNVDHYRVEFAAAPTFSPILVAYSTAGEETSLAGALPMGDWYWRVVGVDTAGLSETSLSRRIQIDTAPPATPVVLRPRPDSYFVKFEPRVSGGNAVDSGCGVETMLVSYSRSPAFATETVVRIVGTDTLITLPDSGVFYLRIAWRDRATNTSAWSDSVMITIGPVGDFNGTGRFDREDAFAFARRYGTAATGLPLADLNEDGVLNLEDVVILLRGLLR